MTGCIRLKILRENIVLYLGDLLYMGTLNWTLNLNAWIQSQYFERNINVYLNKVLGILVYPVQKKHNHHILFVIEGIRAVPWLDSSPTDISPRIDPRLTLPRRTSPKDTSLTGHFSNGDFPDFSPLQHFASGYFPDWAFPQPMRYFMLNPFQIVYFFVSISV